MIELSRPRRDFETEACLVLEARPESRDRALEAARYTPVNIVAIYWIAQSEPGSIPFAGCPVVVAGSFYLALSMRNERRSVGEGRLDLGPVTHRADRSNPCAGGGDDGPHDGEDSGPAE